LIIRLRELERIRLRRGVLIQGLPGIGLVGKMAVDYIIRELKLPKVAELYSEGFFLHGGNVGVLVDERAVLKLPTYDFHLYRGGERDLVFLTAPVQPVSWTQYEVAEHVLDYFQSTGGVEVVGVCGTTMGDGPGVYFATASAEVADELVKLGFKPSPGGVITGACGLLPALAALRGLKAYVLMGYTTRVEPDPAAAKLLVQALCRLYGLKVDLKNLDLLIEELKRREAEMLKALREAARERRGEAPPFYV